jgi:hypothetical protein
MSEINAEVIAPDPIQVAKDAKEYADRIQAQAQAEADRKATKDAVLSKLGLTADEVVALLS